MLFLFSLLSLSTASLVGQAFWGQQLSRSGSKVLNEVLITFTSETTLSMDWDMKMKFPAFGIFEKHFKCDNLAFTTDADKVFIDYESQPCAKAVAAHFTRVKLPPRFILVRPTEDTLRLFILQIDVTMTATNNPPASIPNPPGHSLGAAAAREAGATTTTTTPAPTTTTKSGASSLITSIAAAALVAVYYL